MLSPVDYEERHPENAGRIVGSNCLDERSTIAGVGPITVDPSAQNLGVGRKLMQAVMDRAVARGAAGTRLVQAAFHGFTILGRRAFSRQRRLCFGNNDRQRCAQFVRSVSGKLLLLVESGFESGKS